MLREGRDYHGDVDTGDSTPLVVDQPGSNVALDLLVLTERVGALLGGALSASGLTSTQYAVYAQLALDSQTPTALGETLAMPKSTLSGYLSAMERRGDIHRERATGDGRSWVISLTDQGRERVEAARPLVRRAVQALNDALGGPEQVLEIRGMLGRIDVAIRSVDPHAG